jgi:integrase
LKLTKPLIERSLPVDHRDLFLWDSLQPGFGVRIKATGVRTYVVTYRNHHRMSRRMTLGRHGILTLEQARKLAREAMYAVARGEDPAERRRATRAAPTVQDLADGYLARHAPLKRASSRRNDELTLRRHILPALGSLKVAEVKTSDIERLHLSLADRPYQANRTIALLSRMFTIAIPEGMRPDNPVRGVKRFDEEKRECWLSDDELGRLIETLNQYPNQDVANALKLLILTGARRGEVLNAKWAEFDFERAIWTKPSHHTKQRKTEHTPLSAAALQLLVSMRAHRSGEFLFPSRIDRQPLTEIKKAWARICKLAGLEGVRVHDLRHTFASSLVSSGTSLHIVGRLLGHTQPQTTARYAHVADDALRHATDRFGSKFSSLMPARPDVAADKA